MARNCSHGFATQCPTAGSPSKYIVSSLSAIFWTQSFNAGRREEAVIRDGRISCIISGIDRCQRYFSCPGVYDFAPAGEVKKDHKKETRCL